MEEGRFGFLQEACKGFLKCLGLESGSGGTGVAQAEEVVNNAPPSRTYHPISSADDKPSTDPLVDVLSSTVTVEDTAVTNKDLINNDVENDFSLVTIDEIINTVGGVTTEAHYVKLVDGGINNTNFLTASLISKGGGGKSN